MERYVDTMHGTGATVAQSTEVARHAIQAVNLDHDSELDFLIVSEDKRADVQSVIMEK